MKFKKFYTAIMAENLEESVAFYTDVLGFEKKHMLDRPVGRMAVLAKDGFEIEVMEPLRAEGNGEVLTAPGMYGLRTNVDDMDEAIAYFQEKGCRIVGGPYETKVGKNLVVEDVNGIKICVIQHIK